MGGGDLNLKKSWHPSTLRNIERVWKAEQKHEVEKQKIEQLQKELAEERAREEIQTYAEDQGVVRKKSERLDWMYQGPAALVNREDYLLGRKVDKTFEILEQQETGAEPKKDDFDIGASMFSSQDLSGTATVDLANKIREDPLFSIMKKEKEQRKNLLCNPVKMKQLQQMLQASLGKEKKKKSKKSKKRSDSDSEEKRHKNHKKDKHRKSYSSDEDRPSRNVSKSERNSCVDDRHHRKSSSHNYEERHDKPFYREDRMDSQSSRHSSRNENYSSRQNYSSRDSYEKKSHSKDSESGSNKRKLDEEERERRLREMQANARWREEQRSRNVQRYKEEDEREQKNARKVEMDDFIKPMLTKAAGHGSLENRVKQKVFSIQRSSDHMDKHFARRQ